MRFRLLGELSFRRGDGPVDLGGRKQRAVLAALLADPDQVVPSDRLVHQVWGDVAPRRALTSLQAYVSNLRRLIEPDRRPGEPPAVLLTEAGGYRAKVRRDEVDVSRFEDLHAEGLRLLAAGDPAAAAGHMEAARELYGPVLPELAGLPWVAELERRLEAVHAEVLEGLFEARLALGQDRGFLPDLEAAVAAHPFREGLRGQLALALYRAGRQTDALRALDQARRTLADEVGVELGPELRQLEADILAHDPGLAGPSGRATATTATTAPAAAPTGGEESAPAAGTPPGPDEAAGLVGRAGELAVLLEAADRAAQGSGGAVVISGEPGIGKTRLAEELVRRRPDLAVAWARSTETATVVPASAQIAAQLEEGGALDPDALQRLMAARHPLTPTDPRVDRLELHVAALEALRSATRPLLLVVDDLQWADPTSLRFMEFLAGELRALRVLLVVTVRPLDPDPPPELVACLGELARQPSTRRLDLAGLAEADVATWLARRSSSAVPGDLVALVHHRTGGNPFFVGEVVELLARQHRLTDRDRVGQPGDLGVPAAVHDVVRRRVGFLPAETQQLLPTASVLGETIDVDVLAQVAGQPVSATLDALDPAVDAGLLREVEGAPVRLRFAHALVADALVAELRMSRRARLHAAAVDAIEGLRAATLDDHLPELVHHAAEGAVAGTAEKAVELATRAARRAGDELAYEDAARYWGRALDLLDLARPGNRRARFEVLVELGLARLRADDTAGGQAALLDAILLAEAMGDAEGARRAAAGLSPSSLWESSPYGSPNPQLVAALERVLAGLDGEPTVQRAEILGALADTVYHDAGRSDGPSAEAVEVARRTGDVPTLVRALTRRYQAHSRPGRAHDRLAVAGEMVALAEAHPLPAELASLAYLARATVTFELGDRTTFEADLHRSRSLAERSGSPGPISLTGLFQASWLLVRGHYDEAAAATQETYQLYRQTRGWAADTILDAYLAPIAHDRGEPDALDRLQVHVDREFGAAVGEMMAWLLIEAGRTGEARVLVERAGAIPEVPEDWLWLPTVSTAAQNRACLGDEAACAALYPRLLPYAGRMDMPAGAGPLLGTVDLSLGRMAAVLGDQPAARAHVAAAVELLDRFDARPWLARTLLFQHQLLAASDDDADRAEAKAVRDRCRMLARELGLVPVLRALD